MTDFSDKPSEYLFSKRYSNYVFVLLFLLYMFDYVDRMVVTSMFGSIERDWGISHTESGLLVSAVYWAIVALTFPVSLLVDRWSRTRTISIMAVMWSIATALCAFTGNFIQLFMARLLVGIGEAGYAPGGSAMISGLFPAEKRARMIGIWNAAIPLGSAIGVLMGGMIAARLGWKHAFGIVAVPGFIVAVMFMFVKDYRTVDLVFVDRFSKRVVMKGQDIVREFVTRPSVIYSYFGIACVVFVTTALLTWLPSYIETTRGIAPDRAGQMVSTVMMLAIAGAPLGGILCDRWRRTRENARLLLPAITTLVSALLLFTALVFLEGAVQYAVMLAFGISVLMFISGASAVTQDVVHPGLRAVSYAIAVVVQNLLGASTAPVILGSIYDKADIQAAVTILPFVLLTGSVLFWLGSKRYAGDLKKVAKIQLVAE